MSADGRSGRDGWQVETNHRVLVGRIAETLCGDPASDAGHFAKGAHSATAELESDEIVKRRPTGGPPAPVYYSLTNYGRSLLPLLENVRVWGRGHIERFTT